MAYSVLAPTDAELWEYYRGYPVHPGVSPITLKRYDELLDGFERFRKTNRIIDVGCGAGTFLERAAARGWQVHGTEFGRIPVETCLAKGLQVKEGALDPANYEEGMFDIVTSFEVVEHVMDPGAELEKMQKVLRSGGLLYLTTPNYQCLGHLLAGKEWSVVNYPEHLSLFSPATMSRLLRAKGFSPLKTRTTGVDLMRVTYKRKRDSADRSPIDAKQEALRSKLEGNAMLRLAKRTVDGVLNALRIGDHMKVWATKSASGDRAGD